MTQLRLYSVRTGPLPRACAGCGVVLPPRTRAVLREDRAVFCLQQCAAEHDDAPVEFGPPVPPRRIGSLTVVA